MGHSPAPPQTPPARPSRFGLLRPLPSSPPLSLSPDPASCHPGSRGAGAPRDSRPPTPRPPGFHAPSMAQAQSRFPRATCRLQPPDAITAHAQNSSYACAPLASHQLWYSGLVSWAGVAIFGGAGEMMERMLGSSPPFAQCFRPPSPLTLPVSFSLEERGGRRCWKEALRFHGNSVGGWGVRKPVSPP